MTCLRVLVTLPFYGGSLPVGRYAAQALLDEGHIVSVFEAPAFFSAFSALKTLQVGADRLAQLENSFLHTVSQAIYAKVESFEPDLVLCLAQAPLDRATLRRLERDKTPTAMWFVEDHQVFPYWRAFAPCYDFFFTIQKEPLLDMLRAEGRQGQLPAPGRLAVFSQAHATGCGGATPLRRGRWFPRRGLSQPAHGLPPTDKL